MSSTYVPADFKQVGVAEYWTDRNGVVRSVKLLECLKCGRQIKGVGFGIGSHRRSCS